MRRPDCPQGLEDIKGAVPALDDACVVVFWNERTGDTVVTLATWDGDVFGRRGDKRVDDFAAYTACYWRKARLPEDHEHYWNR